MSAKKHDGNKEPINLHGGWRWELPPDQKRTRKNYRFPPDVIKILDELPPGEQTNFIIAAIREKAQKGKS